MTLLGFALVFCGVAMVCLFPRRWAPVGILFVVCYVSQGQAIEIAALNFHSIRIVLLAALARVVLRGEVRDIQWNLLDRGVLVFAFVSSAIFMIREPGALGEQSGAVYDIVVPYIVFRSLVPTFETLRAALPPIAVTIAPLAVLVLYEAQTGRNIFSAMGGISEFVELRNGYYRCQGAFRSPISLGSFGATLMPIFVGLYRFGERRRFALLGVVVSVVFVVASHSSGPALAAVATTIALMAWPLRDRTRVFKWGLIIGIVAVDLVMKAPVWFLMGRASNVIGGGGWHRAYLIDTAIQRLSEWWLIGTNETSDWMATTVVATGGADLTNQFLSVGKNGGILSIILFIIVLRRAFRGLAAVREDDPVNGKFAWGLTAALVGTSIGFFSATYFDQMIAVYYLLLAGASAAWTHVVQSEGVESAIRQDRLQPSTPAQLSHAD